MFGAAMTDPSDTMHAEPGVPEATAAVIPKGRGGVLLLVFTVLVLVGVAITGYMMYSRISASPDKAKVGDCLSGTTAQKIKLVDCSDSSAVWRVVGKVTVNHDPSQDEQIALCVKWPTDKAFHTAGKDYLLCLANK
jgi:hypothetical protein